MKLDPKIPRIFVSQTFHFGLAKLLVPMKKANEEGNRPMPIVIKTPNPLAEEILKPVTDVLKSKSLIAAMRAYHKVKMQSMLSQQTGFDKQVEQFLDAKKV